MSDVLNRTTKQYLISVNTPDFPTANWIINPDLSAVVGFEAKYWTITGDVVTLMSQAERDAVDAAEAAQAVQDRRTAANTTPDEVTALGVEFRALVELVNKRDNYLTNRVLELQAAFDAIKASSGPADNIRNAIPASWLATATRDRPTAISAYKADVSAGVAD